MPNPETVHSTQILENVKQFGRGVLAAVALSSVFGGMVATVSEISDPAVAAASSDDYPYKAASDCSATYGKYSWCMPGDDEISPLGYAYRNCTDWTAWKVKQLIGRSPTGLRDGGRWDDNAVAHGYKVNDSPEPGDAAVWDYTYPGDQYGHVAYVESVNADGSVNVSEYNVGGKGTYGTRNNVRAHHYVDFNGSATTETATGPSVNYNRPAVVSRGNGSMDVFYRDSANQLVVRVWDSDTGWGGENILADNLAGNPAVVSQNYGNLEVFYRTTDGKLFTRGWNWQTGWNGGSELVSSDVMTDPSAISRSEGNMDVFFEGANGSLMNAGWDWQKGWSINQLTGSGVAGEPVAITRNPDTMDVFFRGNDGKLVNVYWDVSRGWYYQIFDAHLSGDPTAITQNDHTMQVFFPETDGSVGEWSWDADPSIGWRYIDHGGHIIGEPTSVSVSEGHVDVFFRDANNQLMDLGWDVNRGWATNPIPENLFSGDPAAVSQSSGNIEVFGRDMNGGLRDAGWDSNTGWRSSPLGGSLAA